MRKFREREYDVMVATTVIEVGVDVPNATVMIIEHAERFGLAQLHQLRGRVGRGSADSACVLVASKKLAPGDGMQTSDELEQSSLAMQRLNTLVANVRRFRDRKKPIWRFVARGEVLGVKQSGKVMLKIREFDDRYRSRRADDEGRRSDRKERSATIKTRARPYAHGVFTALSRCGVLPACRIGGNTFGVLHVL